MGRGAGGSRGGGVAGKFSGFEPMLKGIPEEHYSNLKQIKERPNRRGLSGEYNAATRTITMDSNYRKDHPGLYSRTLKHEVGHNVWDYHISNEQRVRLLYAYERDIHRMETGLGMPYGSSPSQSSRGFWGISNYVSSYGATNVEEAFSEAYAYHFHGGRGSQQRVAKMDPEFGAVLREIS